MAFKTFINGNNLPASDLNTYLMQQSVITFANAAARTSAITTPVEGMTTYLTDVDRFEFWTGSAWKRITGETYSSLADRTTNAYPVDGQLSYLTATSATDTANQIDFYNGSAWESIYTPGRNAVINGGFDIFQRTTFSSQTASNYCLDRWYASVGGTVTITQQTTGVPVGSQYCARVAYNGASNFANLRQALSSDIVAPLRGQTVTISAKIRRNASFSANIIMALAKNATADTLAGGTWSEISATTIPNASLPSGTTSADWCTVSATIAIPNDGTANGLRIEFRETAAGGSGAYWELAQVQLEAGSVATPFRRAGGTLQGELAACQRYYEKSTSDNFGWSGVTNPGNAYYGFGTFQVAKRVAPTVTTGTTGGTGTGFPSGNPGAEYIDTHGFRAYMISNASTGGGSFITTFIANAEL